MACRLPNSMRACTPERATKVRAKILQLVSEAQAQGVLPHPTEIRHQLRKSRLINLSSNAIHMQLYHLGIPHVGCQTVAPPELQTKVKEVRMIEHNGDGVDEQAHLENLRQQLRESRTKETEALRRLGRQEELYEALRHAVTVLPPPPVHFDLQPHGDPEEHPQEAIALMACLHIGEVVSPEKTFGLGDYDLKMAQARMQVYVDSVIDLLINHHSGERFRRLWVVCLGDTVNGTIHQELERAQEFGAARQVVEAGNLLALALRDLAAYFPEVVFIGYPGNHGRIHKEPSFIDKTDNYDNLAYTIAKERVRDIPNVEVRIPESFFTIENINTHTFLFTHGDMIRGWGGLPWYGTQRVRANLRELVERLGISFEYICLSHFHTAMSLEETYGETFFTGSSKGPCGFSIGTKGVGSDPMWWLLGVHHEQGCSFRYPVKMKRADRNVHTRYQG